MKKINDWLKKNWTDPVWSKVIAGVILAILGFIITLLFSLLKEVSINNIYQYLINNRKSFSYLTLLLITIVILSVLIPGIIFYIRVRIAMNTKGIKDEKLNAKFEKFINGKWKLTYVHVNGGAGSEIIEIRNGTNYYINNNLIFIMKEISYSEKNKSLNWQKFRVQNQQIHSNEVLKIVDHNTMAGTDNIEFKLTYIRI